MLFDYHIHLENGPYEIQYLVKYVQTARQRGIEEIGVSEHAYNFAECSHLWPPSWNRNFSRSLDEYVSLIRKARGLGLPLKLGIEMDYVPGMEKESQEILRAYEWDYVIGSVHHLDDWGFDIPAQKGRWELVDVDEAYRRYFDLLKGAALSGLFDILAHPDVIKVFGYRPLGDLKEEYEALAETVKQSGCVVEINTAGLRKPVGEMYPHADLMRAFVQRGVGMVISSDAHEPEDVGKDFDVALKYAAEAGVGQLIAFDRRQRIVVPIGEQESTHILREKGN